MAKEQHISSEKEIQVQVSTIHHNARPFNSTEIWNTEMSIETIPLVFKRGLSTDLTMGHLVEISKENPRSW